MTEGKRTRAIIHSTARMAEVQPPIIPFVGELIRDNPGTINLGQGIVDYAPPVAVKAAVNAFFDDPLNHRYKLADGIPALKAVIKQKLATENNIALSHQSECIVTAGSNMAFLQAILAITDPGDEVIILSPYYFNHEMAIRIANATPVIVATDENHQPLFNAIVAAITDRTRAVVTISPNNPTGAVYSREMLTAINALCRDKAIYHINDEAYEYFVYGDAEHFSPASITNSVDHTISLFSLSKTYGMASWRVGYMLFPAHLTAALKKIQDTNLICPPVISQHAAVAALKCGRDFCATHIARLANVRSTIIEQLARQDKIHYAIPHGAFYFFIKSEGQHEMLALTKLLIEQHGVAAIPGNTFGIENHCYFRVAYGALSQDEITIGIERLVTGLIQSTG